MWFRDHIYEVIQNLNGNTRAKRVRYLKNNSMLLHTKVQGQKLENLNELIESYLKEHKETEAIPPAPILPKCLPEMILPNRTKNTENTTAKIESEELHAIMQRMEMLDSEDIGNPITEVLTEYEVISKDGKPLEGLFKNEKYTFDRVILPAREEIAFRIVRSNLVVHWSK